MLEFMRRLMLELIRQRPKLERKKLCKGVSFGILGRLLEIFSCKELGTNSKSTTALLIPFSYLHHWCFL